MMLDDIPQFRQEKTKRFTISGSVEETSNRLEVPERRVRRVVEALAFMFRKEVGKQTVLYIVTERTQDVSGLDFTSRGESQAFKTDHGVAAPVCKPMVAGEDRTYF